MDRAYRNLMGIQSVLALANATAGIFTTISLLKNEGFDTFSAVLFSLLTFAVASVTCIALVLSRPRRGGLLMITGLSILASSYLVFLFAHGWFLLVYVGVAWGVYIPLFFVPFNALVVATTRTEDRAGRIGSFIFAYTAVAIVAPTLGGAIITGAGYSVVFAFAALILLANVALVARLCVGHERITFAFAFTRLGPRTSIALFAEGGFEGMVFGVVPILAYLFARDELAIGGLYSLFALAGGAITVLLGLASDRFKDRRPFLVAGAAATAASTVLVVIATSLPSLALGNSLVSLTSPIAPLFLLTMAVERIPDRPAAAVVTREILLNGGRTVSLAAFLVLLVLGVPPTHGFALAGASVAVVALAQAWRPPTRESPGASV